MFVQTIQSFIWVQTLESALNPVERIDQLTMRAEARRNAALREIDRHRAAFAQGLRDKVRDVEDAEFKVVEPKAIPVADTAQKDAA
jgi:hypothetical protein